MSLSCPDRPISGGHEASPVIQVPGCGLKPGPRDAPGTWDAPMSIRYRYIVLITTARRLPRLRTENVPTYVRMKPSGAVRNKGGAHARLITRELKRE